MTRMKYFLFLLSFTYAVAAEQPQELFWEDLVPADFVPPEVAIEHSFSMAQVAPNAPVVDELDGKFIKIPGFVVPLEGTRDAISEFLLVPFFGACIHVPPPPSNQIVHVTFVEPVPIEKLYDAVWITGHMSTEGWKGAIASVGYRLEGIQVEAFE